MNARQADALGAEIAGWVQRGTVDQACAMLDPVLAGRTPFRYLDRIGRAVGAGSPPETNTFLERIAAGQTEGQWVVIGSALNAQRDRDLDSALARCRIWIATTGTWYASDILGERVPGPALVETFERALDILAHWRQDPNRWVRRSLGVAVHFWAKRSRGAPDLAAQAGALLEFLDPMFEEWEMDAVKGIGWGLKTLGRTYPDLVAGWLEDQVVQRHRRHRALMLRKAITHLPDHRRVRLTTR
jgi:3-methyladenine DNA glycosylase AlkD